ncbi:MAG: KOW domain-containing RNA-binding protein [Roseburia sp.]|nr:KOW domain-containing RNA-binding protein [Roseburia sp.]
MEFAKSLSGHDKNQYYFVLQKEAEFFLLVNGTNRPLEKPKRKNEKHVQIIKKLPAEIEQILAKEQSNLTIKRAIQNYEKSVSHKQEEN